MTPGAVVALVWSSMLVLVAAAASSLRSRALAQLLVPTVPAVEAVLTSLQASVIASMLESMLTSEMS